MKLFKIMYQIDLIIKTFGCFIFRALYHENTSHIDAQNFT